MRLIDSLCLVLKKLNTLPNSSVLNRLQNQSAASYVLSSSDKAISIFQSTVSYISNWAKITFLHISSHYVSILAIALTGSIMFPVVFPSIHPSVPISENPQEVWHKQMMK